MLNELSDHNQAFIASRNPTSGELLAIYRPFAESVIEQKLELAVQSFSKYRLMKISERAEILLRIAAVLECESESLARLITTEMGKLFRTAKEEVSKCASACRYFAAHAERLLEDEPVETTATRSYIRYQPIGPVLGFVTWNFPLWQVFRFAVPALMAGNVCLLKHAPNVPQCSQFIDEIFRRAGAPEGLFQSLFLSAEQAEAVLDDSRVKAVTLTGSIEAGRSVASRAGRGIKKIVLELGGNDPFIVMPSADVAESVLAAVESRTTNNGQSCTAGKRFILAESIADAFEEQFVERMSALRVGDPMNEATDIGPLATERVLAKLERQVEESISAGCRVRLRGGRLNCSGYFFSPAVLTNIEKSSVAYHQELYGPVASLFRVRSVDDAIRLANDSIYGLGASVWTNDPNEQERFVREIEVGMIFINKRVRSDPRLPFGGIKSSGFGRELGAHGLREFTASKTVWIQEIGRRLGTAAG